MFCMKIYKANMFLNCYNIINMNKVHCPTKDTPIQQASEAS